MALAPAARRAGALMRRARLQGAYTQRLRHLTCVTRPQRVAEITSASEVPVPLCKRPASNVESLRDLLAWRSDVLARIEEVGDAFEAADGGPGRQLLQRELTWALEDAVAAYREAPSAPWRPASWQQLESEARAARARAARQGGAAGGEAGGGAAGGEGLLASACSGGGGGGDDVTAAWEVQLRATVAELRRLWRRRLEERAPFQYLIHAAHWRDFVLSVGPGVLVPRPETEQMVDMAASAIAARPALAAAPWADLGTGSGALAIGLAALLRRERAKRNKQQQQEREQQEQRSAAGAGPPAAAGSAARGSGGGGGNAAAEGGAGGGAGPLVWAVDLSPAAAAYAAANAAVCARPGAITVARGSWWGPLGHLKGALGGVLTNPPYIPRREMAGLQAEVGAHEPWGALDGGEGPGLDSLEVICAGAGEMLVPGGYIAIETAGGEQAERVRDLLLASGAFERAGVVDDCFGVARFVEAHRRAD